MRLTPKIERRLKEQFDEVKWFRKTLPNVLRSNPSSAFIMWQINIIHRLRAKFLYNHQTIMSKLQTKQSKYAVKKRRVYLKWQIKPLLSLKSF